MITVLVASRNGSRYIEQQLDSILAQSLKDICILVSDDCSDDGTRELLAGYEEDHRGRVLVLNRKHASGGASIHFLKLLKLMADCRDCHRLDQVRELLEDETWEANTGEAGAGEDKAMALLKMAGAGYFMLSDQDDVWMPYKAEVLLEKIREMEGRQGGGDGGRDGDGDGGRDGDGDGGRAILVHSDLQVVDENLQPIADSFFRYQKISPERTRLRQLLVQNNVTGGAVMLNQAMLPFLKRIPGTCLMHDAWLALIASCFGAIGCVERPLYYYRQHGANTLGAEKGDSMESLAARVKDGSSARDNYRKMFGQAECFYTMFGDRLEGGERETLEAFIRLPRQGRLGKIGLILRYGFTKNTLLRTLGQMLFMGD